MPRAIVNEEWRARAASSQRIGSSSSGPRVPAGDRSAVALGRARPRRRRDRRRPLRRARRRELRPERDVRAGGVAIVQDPDEAAILAMPLAALRETDADTLLPAAQIGPAIVRACEERPAVDGNRMPTFENPDPRPVDDTLVADVGALHGRPTPIMSGLWWSRVRSSAIVSYSLRPRRTRATAGTRPARSD